MKICLCGCNREIKSTHRKRVYFDKFCRRNAWGKKNLYFKNKPSIKRTKSGTGTGGTRYKDHYQMKKNRIIKLKSTNGKCEICKEPAYMVHHKDHSKDNHSLENLQILCNKCHFLIHTGRKNTTSKFIREYGCTIEDLCGKLNLTHATIYSWHRKGILKQYIKDLRK